MSQRSQARPETNLITLHNIKLKKALRYFSRRTVWEQIPVVILPKRRPALSMRMVIPDGTNCLVTESEKQIGQFKPGLYYRSMFFQVSRCITTQYIPYHFTNNDIRTRDEVQIVISVDILLHVTNASVMAKAMVLDTLEEHLRSKQTEVIRSLGKTCYSHDAYDLRGRDTEYLMESLNDKFTPLGISIDQVNIASVTLPPELAKRLQDTTAIKAREAKNLQIHQLNFLSQDAMLRINKLRIDKQNELEKVRERMQKEYDAITNDMREITAKKDKEIQRIKAQFKDKSEQLIAQGAFEVGKLDAQRDSSVSEILSNADIEAKKILAEGELYVARVKAEADYKIAKNKAKIIALRGEAEKVAQGMLAAQRSFDRKMKEIEILQTVANNPNNIVTGEAETNDIAKLLVASKTAESMGIKMRKY